MKIVYTLALQSDAEPGTGLGGDLVNDHVPRTLEGLPILRASHIRGLLREQVREIGSILGRDDLDSRLFGRPGQSMDCEGVLSVADAKANEESISRTRILSRTAINERGTAEEHTLRSTEAVAAQVRFTGSLQLTATEGSEADLAVRAALLSLPAVGGGRTRGSGSCLVTIEGENRTPGDLVKILATVSQLEVGSAPASGADTGSPGRESLGSGTAVLRLTFFAESPICCPQTPLTPRVNTIRSGFSIPASAVQGAVLHRLNRLSPELATACFEDDRFRPWPLHPCGEQEPEGVPIRVSLTHRVAKLAIPESFGEGEVQDEAIEPYDWKNVPDGSPLKAADGVLLLCDDGHVELWRAAHMPRVLSAHGVHHDRDSDTGRNLFTVEAMAPLCYRGLIALPASAAETLLESLSKDPTAFFGKGRGVRGRGRLTAEVVEDGRPPEWTSSTRTTGGEGKTILVAQSPLLLEDSPPNGELVAVEDEILSLFRDWCERFGLPTPVRGWGVAGIRFGWSRHRQDGKQRTRARRVLQPGAVVSFDQVLDPEKLAMALAAGVGGGRQLGFGAVASHPGKAAKERPGRSRLPTLSTNGAGALQVILGMVSRGTPLPSPSQISALQQRLARGGREQAAAYLQRQVEERGTRIWRRWEPIHKEIAALIDQYEPDEAAQALRTLIDLAITGSKEGKK